ncbi:hypothetical protein DUI87_00339 [Hirundo rustica rustica]|uniref:SEA domain-containing protein n=1 Tax=Hirundo rustica rustica TaxID=333673 RepID=A0A3M0LF60_HIRRU|nr:hypothetical protein DUI87_00339 [Hirundo rustica rustica]
MTQLQTVSRTGIHLGGPETNGTVQVELRVTNRDFTEDLEDPTSPTYVEFVQDFTKQVKGHETPSPPPRRTGGVGIYPEERPDARRDLQILARRSPGPPGRILGGGPLKMREIREDEQGNGPSRLTWGHLLFQMDVVYADIEGYKGIEVHSLKPGSVVVDHSIIVSLLVTAQSQEKLQNITANVQEKIEQAATQFNCTNGDMCFNSSEVVVTETPLEFDEEGPSFGLTPVVALPTSCDETHLYWYQDDRCVSRVSKLAVGLGLAVAVLVIVVAVLSIFLIRARRSESFNL